MRIADRACWSPLGQGPAAFAEILTGAREHPSPRHGPDLPPTGALPVPGFDLAAEVGAKGVRSMDRATALAVAATGRLLDRASAHDLSRTGIVLATTTGSLKTMLDIGVHSLTKPKPYQIDPGQIPVSVMNYAAGQCAIRHHVTGPNATIRGGRSSMAQALRYAQRLLDSGRVDQVLCGAAEEATAPRAWAEHRARAAEEPARALGEGCAMFRLVPAHDPEGPRIDAIETRVACAEPPATALEGAIRNALRIASGSDRDRTVLGSAIPNGAAIDSTLGSTAPNPAAHDDDRNHAAAQDLVQTGHRRISTVATCGSEAEDRALDAVFGRAPHRIAVDRLVGETSAAAIGFGLIALVATAPPGERFALTAIDRTGLAACIIGRT